MADPHRQIEGLEAVVLVGGRGTRLRPAYSAGPKPLAPVAGRPFLAWVLRALQSQGVGRVVLSSGERAEQIDQFAASAVDHGLELDIAVAAEPEPLGTGGALRFAAEQTSSSRLLVLNGDTFCRFDLPAFLHRHASLGAKATLLLSAVLHANRFGSVELDDAGLVRAFREKDEKSASVLVNAGAYLIERSAVLEIPTGREVSLEHEIFPTWTGGRLAGFETNAPLIDMGTPASWLAADARPDWPALTGPRPSGRPHAFTSLFEELVYETLRIRRVEERIAEIYPTDRIQSPVHLSIGQEPIAVAACRPLRRTDPVFGTYRSHAFYLAKGGDLASMMAELFGKATGCGGGKAGSMHLADPDVGVMGSSAVVSSTIAHAVGAALAARRLGRDQVILCDFGDGATEEGVYHEALNFASLHRLPVLFVCENNDLAIHSRRAARQSYDIAKHAQSYGLRVSRIKNGNDLLELSAHFEAEVAQIRQGEGPALVEIETYRYREHVGPSEDYDDGYREREELEHWRASDLLALELELVERFEPAIEREIDLAVQFAEESPVPGPEHLLQDVTEPPRSQTRDAALAAISAERAGARSAHEVEGGVLSYRDALRHAMRDALDGREETLILGQGVDDHRGIFGTTLGLAEDFGAERVLDTPIAEEGITGVAVGAALNGLYPIVTHIRADFALLAMNQIVNLAAKYRYMFGGRFEVPMLMRLVIGRSWGQGAQHSQSIQSMLAHVPGLRVIMPASATSVLDAYRQAIDEYPGPVISLEHRLLYDIDFRHDAAGTDAAPAADALRGSKCLRSGGDVTLVATSIMVLEALRAAEHLEREAGIACEVIDLHSISDPDAALILSSVRKTGRLLVADTSWGAYGVAAEVCRIVAQNDPAALRAPVESVGMQAAPCPTAKALEDLYYPTLNTLADAVARLATGSAAHGIPLPSDRSMTEVYRQFRGPF